MSEIDLTKELRSSRKIMALAGEVERVSACRINIMEVCGGHTHVIMKYGINQILPDDISFLHGPGCPVCIMPKERIDHAIALAREEGVILVTLGDMMRVPGSSGSLITERAEGMDVRMVYSPLDIIRIARQNPEKSVVYFAIGFETTTPLTAALIQQSLDEGVSNILFHVNHVLVPPALHAVMSAEDVQVNAFIAPGHVSAITGSSIYDDIAAKYGVPVVISGFEPVDILQSVLMIAEQVRDGRSEVEIQYRRAVTADGNLKAQELTDKYFQRASFMWRGIGDIPESALQLREEFNHLNAEEVYRDILPLEGADDHKLCICGDILRGKASPDQCKLFGKACTPGNPAGACMVSSEGACHAYHRFRQA